MANTFALPTEPQHEEAKKAHLILLRAHEAAESFLDTYDTLRSARGGGRPPPGTPTDTEQNLLRAMVVFAGAGLDSMTKQLVKDTLPTLLATDSQAHTQLQNFSVRQLRRESPDAEVQQVNLSMLSELLLEERPRDKIIGLLVDDLTGSSLQSAEQLLHVLGHLGISGPDVGLRRRELRPVFNCRNEIIHELDINLAARNRNRIQRRKTNMVTFARQLLRASASILSAVDNKLS